jgi:hypothetical protein
LNLFRLKSENFGEKNIFLIQGYPLWFLKTLADTYRLEVGFYLQKRDMVF